MTKIREVNSNKGLFIHSAIPIQNKSWENWNGEIHFFPNAIFEPSALEDLIDIVKLAKINHKTIRCAQGHTISSLSVAENYLVIVTNLNKVTVQKHPKYGISLSDFENVLRNCDPPLTIDSATNYNIFRVSGVIATGKEISESEFNAAKLNLESSDGIEFYYWLFNGFNQSDPNPLDPNRDNIWIINLVRTDEPHESQKQNEIQHLTSNSNTSFIYQAPDAIHNEVNEESIKYELMEIAFKVDPDFSNIVTELSLHNEIKFIPNVRSYLSEALSDQIKKFDNKALTHKIIKAQNKRKINDYD
ncbi:2766_t:CDS:2 [Gigaspora margarita]|uniref:2766_t:CDS:1 n=1 Tax=Gigaspora margarita TaxID=4874 RepID=A0ABN7UKB1_GIGMA|nr:2766_t:CDS:2 [Gigaspora margarita]